MVCCSVIFNIGDWCNCFFYYLFNKDLNFETYKTVVGKTTENSLGSLTLNEVIVDDNQILLNATFKPENDTLFDYQIFFFFHKY